MYKKFLTIVFLLSIAGAYLFVNYNVPQMPYSIVENSQVDGECPTSDYVTVANVIDGDTMVVDGDTLIVDRDYHIRLLGIDADEKNEPCYKQAKDKLASLVINKKVTLERDGSDVDRYQRCLRFVFLNGENINARMVEEGFARVNFYGRELNYQNVLVAAEKYAVENKLGCVGNY